MVFLRKICLGLSLFLQKFPCVWKICFLLVCIFFPCIGCFSLAIIKKKQACFKKTMRRLFYGRKYRKMPMESLTLWVVAAVLFCWGLISFLLPDDMTLMAGRTTAYNLRLPVSVKTEESVEVLGISASLRRIISICHWERKCLRRHMRQVIRK